MKPAQSSLVRSSAQLIDHLAGTRDAIDQVVRMPSKLTDRRIILEVSQNDLNAPIGKIEDPESATHVLLALKMCCMQITQYICESSKPTNCGMKCRRPSTVREIDYFGHWSPPKNQNMHVVLC